MEEVRLQGRRNGRVTDIVLWLDQNVAPNALENLASYSHSGSGRYAEWQAIDDSWRLRANDIPVKVTAYFKDPEMATLFRLVWA